MKKIIQMELFDSVPQKGKCSKKGFTLIELLVSIVIASVMVLTIGVLTEQSNSSHKKFRKKGDIYNDIAYGLKLFQNKIRSSESITKTPPSAITPVLPGNTLCPWLSNTNFEQLFFVNDISGINTQRALGICEVGNTKYLIYVPDMNATVKNAEILFSASNPGITKFNVILGSNQSVTLQLTGNKNQIADISKQIPDVSTTIWRRTQ